jgi:hypothetical protein
MIVFYDQEQSCGFDLIKAFRKFAQDATARKTPVYNDMKSSWN